MAAIPGIKASLEVKSKEEALSELQDLVGQLMDRVGELERERAKELRGQGPS